MFLPYTASRVQILATKFTTSLGLPFQQLLPSTIQTALDTEKIEYRCRLFDPFVIGAFLSQVLDTDKSCANTVSPGKRMVD